MRIMNNLAKMLLLAMLHLTSKLKFKVNMNQV
jgi:hypothetical protein